MVCTNVNVRIECTLGMNTYRNIAFGAFFGQIKHMQREEALSVFLVVVLSSYQLEIEVIMEGKLTSSASSIPYTLSDPARTSGVLALTPTSSRGRSCIEFSAHIGIGMCSWQQPFRVLA